MIRRISTKWVLSVLVAVVGPFVGFAWFVNVKVSDRMSGDVVRYHLLSMVADLSERVDEEIEERREDVALAARVPTVAWLIGNVLANFAALEKTFGFGFLWELPANYDINQTLIDYNNQDTHLRAALVGLLNTALVAVIGIGRAENGDPRS